MSDTFFLSDALLLLDLPLVRTTLLLTAACLIVLGVLRQGGHGVFARCCWCGVLLLGWFWLQIPCQIPWYAEITEDRFAQRRGEDQVRKEDKIFRQEEKIYGEVISEESIRNETQPLDTLGELRVIAPLRETSPQETKSRELPLREIAFTVWGLGMIVVVLRWCVSYCRFLRRLRQTVPADAESTAAWEAVLAEHHQSTTRKLVPNGSRERNAVKRPDRTQDDPVTALRSVPGCHYVRRLTDNIPMLFGEGLGPSLVWTLRGWRLVVPRDLWDDLSPLARSGILRHELAHYLRRDAWKSLAVRILALPHWFNPLAHLAVRKFDEAAECLCDEAAWSGSAESRRAFAETLLVLHESEECYVVFRPALRGKGLQDRISHLINYEKRKELSPMRKFVLLMIVTTLFAVLSAVGLFRVELVARQVVPENEQTQTTEILLEEPPAATDASEAVDEPSNAVCEIEQYDLSVLEATKDDPHKLGLFITDEKEERVWLPGRNWLPDEKQYRIRGRVLLPDGSPAANVRVFYYLGSAYTYDNADDEGYFTTLGLRGSDLQSSPYAVFGLYAVVPVTKDNSWQWAATCFSLEDLVNQPEEKFVVKLKKGVKITGTLTTDDENPSEDLSKQTICIDHVPEVYKIGSGGHFWPIDAVAKDGQFEFWLAPGKYILYPNRTVWESVKTEVIIKEGDTQKTVELKLPKRTQVRVVREDGLPVPNGKHAYATMYTSPQQRGYSSFNFFTDSDGIINDYMSPFGNLIHSSDRERNEGGFLYLEYLEGEDTADKNYTITMRPLVDGKVRLVDQTGKPLVGIKLQYDLAVRCGDKVLSEVYREKSQTNANGEAELTGLVPGGDYLLRLGGPVDPAKFEKSMPGDMSMEAFRELTKTLHRELNEQLVPVPLSAKPDTTHDLGSVTVELPEVK
ncbi:MAG: M56 family metallopeptidase [Planctomycetaceae bacterium]|nr:M56 family metallopeptidase [Planctomycetaceae bacterium]